MNFYQNTVALTVLHLQIQSHKHVSNDQTASAIKHDAVNWLWQRYTRVCCGMRQCSSLTSKSLTLGAESKCLFHRHWPVGVRYWINGYLITSMVCLSYKVAINVAVDIYVG